MTRPLSERSIADDCAVLDIPADAVSLEMAELSLALGYPTAEPPADMAGLISSTAAEIQGLCAFQGGYVLQPLAFDASRPDGLLLGDRFFRTGNIIRNQMKDAEQAAIFIGTIGPEPEQRVKQLMENGEPALGFIADTAASVLAEKVAEAIHRHLEQKLAEAGLGVTNRFSPGYCGWNVREQLELFRFLPDGFCGVHLEDSSFMQPRKSVSAIAGIGKSLKRQDHPCSNCDDNLCLYGETVRED